MELVPEGAEGMELVPEAATVMGEVLQSEQEANVPAVAAGEVEVTTEQPEAAGDELLSTDEISGEYSAPGCVDVKICNSMTVAPLGPDAIEMWPGGEVRTRKPGTNAFRDPRNTDPNSDLMKFSADGTAGGGYKKRPGSQKRTFQKVETTDLAGKWKKALNEDQYAESGLCCWVVLPIPVSETRTRKYVHGHPTNGFAKDVDPRVLNHDVHWHRDPGCAGGFTDGPFLFFAKKVG